MNFRPALRLLGRLILLLAGTELAPAACAALYGEWQDVGAFGWSAAITAVCGIALIVAGSSSGRIFRREGILIVVAVGS